MVTCWQVRQHFRFGPVEFVSRKPDYDNLTYTGNLNMRVYTQTNNRNKYKNWGDSNYPRVFVPKYLADNENNFKKKMFVDRSDWLIEMSKYQNHQTYHKIQNVKWNFLDFCADVLFSLKEILRYNSLYNRGSQPACRDTIVCHILPQCVPPNKLFI